MVDAIIEIFHIYVEQKLEMFIVRLCLFLFILVNECLPDCFLSSFACSDLK